MHNHRILVNKFGGKTIDDVNKVRKACENVSSQVERGCKVVSVASARAGVTDLLLELIQAAVKGKKHLIRDTIEKIEEEHKDSKALFQETILLQLLDKLEIISKRPDKQLLNEVKVIGEIISSEILHNALIKKGVKVYLKRFQDYNYPSQVITENSGWKIDSEKTKRGCLQLEREFDLFDCIILPGYAAVDPQKRQIFPLGRGGSDQVAMELSRFLDADELWIITDTQGIMTADPDIVPNARTVPILTVEELLDAVSLGAKGARIGLYMPLLEHCPAETYLAHYADLNGPRTQIVRKFPERLLRKDKPVKLVAGKGEMIVYDFEGYDLIYNLPELNRLRYIFDTISSGGHRRKITFAFLETDRRAEIEEEISKYRRKMNIKISKPYTQAFIGVVGAGMAYRQGIVSAIGKALSDILISVEIGVSNISSAVLINKRDYKKGMISLHRHFIEEGEF